MSQPLSADQLITDLRDARARTIELIQGLSGPQLMGPQLDIVNPLLWEIGHLAWFHEHFILCGLDRKEPILAETDALYDSMKVHHDTRWGLPLPSLEGTLQYMQDVEDALIERLPHGEIDAENAYLYQLTTFHEDMHDEAFTYTRQTLGFPTPEFALAADTDSQAIGSGDFPGDVEIPGGTIELGSRRNGAFVFDNEKWAHPVEIAAFAMARAPTTNAAYRDFVEDGGYGAEKYWDEEGWRWRAEVGAEHPVHWAPDASGGWTFRFFDRFVELPPDQPVIHVNWYEANAWCRWAERRLPTEAEWEATASYQATGESAGLAGPMRRYPWGELAPGPSHANLDGRNIGCVDVGAYPDGESAFGCRQMLGNVWEWTSSVFSPYGGFAPDAYKDYSEPWFETRKVLRGGAWATRGRMITNAYRNFFTPDRRDTLNGFRSCAI